MFIYILILCVYFTTVYCQFSLLFKGNIGAKELIMKKVLLEYNTKYNMSFTHINYIYNDSDDMVYYIYTIIERGFTIIYSDCLFNTDFLSFPPYTKDQNISLYCTNQHKQFDCHPHVYSLLSLESYYKALHGYIVYGYSNPARINIVSYVDTIDYITSNIGTYTFEQNTPSPKSYKLPRNPTLMDFQILFLLLFEDCDLVVTHLEPKDLLAFLSVMKDFKLYKILSLEYVPREDLSFLPIDYIESSFTMISMFLEHYPQEDEEIKEERRKFLSLLEPPYSYFNDIDELVYSHLNRILNFSISINSNIYRLSSLQVNRAFATPNGFKMQSTAQFLVTTIFIAKYNGSSSRDIEVKNAIPINLWNLGRSSAPPPGLKCNYLFLENLYERDTDIFILLGIKFDTIQKRDIAITFLSIIESVNLNVTLVFI